MAFNSATESLIVGGGSDDDVFRRDTSVLSRLPWLFMYSGPEFNFIWAKQIKGAPVPYTVFQGLEFSVDGSVVAAATDSTNYILVLRASDGTLIDCRKMNVVSGGYLKYYSISRSLLVSKRQNKIIIYFTALTCPGGTCAGYALLSYSATDFTSDPIWNKKSIESTSTNVNLGLVFGET